MAIASVQVTINGSVHTLTYNSTSGKYEGTISAPADTSASATNGVAPGVGTGAANLGYYPVTVTATDDAGNVTAVDSTDQTFGSILRLVVKETAKPVAAISYPTNGATITNATPNIVFTITDAGSGVDGTTCYIVVDSGTPVAVTPVFSVDGTVATCTYTPGSNLVDGLHTIEVYGEDYDGNASLSATAQFKVDTTPPTLNITTPADNVKVNTSTINVVGTTNDANSTPVTVVITVGQDTYTPTIEAGAFSQAVTLAEGSNTITIVATDASGLSSSATRTVILDTVAPTIVSITLSPNPVDTEGSYSIAVEVTDA